MQAVRVRVLLLTATMLLAGCGTNDDLPAPPPAPAPAAVRAVPAPAVSAPAAPASSPAPPAGVTLPPYGPLDYQIGGPYEPAPGTAVVTRDHSVDSARGTYGICYLNAFQTQPEDRQFWDEKHPGLLLRVDGKVVEDENWPGELVLDTRRADDLLAVLRPWVDECADRGFQAIEPDNLDSYGRSQGALTEDDNLALVRELAAYAHGRGLAVAQKNAAELGTRGRDAGLDLAVSEDCQQYDECDVYTELYPRLLEVEYDEGAFQDACEARGGRTAVLLRDRDVVPKGSPGHLSRTC